MIFILFDMQQVSKVKMLWRLLSQRALQCYGSKYEHFINDQFYETPLEEKTPCCKCGTGINVKNYHHSALTYYYTIRRCYHPLCAKCAESICQQHRIFNEPRKVIAKCLPLPLELSNVVMEFLNMREFMKPKKS